MNNAVISRLGKEQGLSIYNPSYARVKPALTQQSGASGAKGKNSVSPSVRSSPQQPQAVAKPNADSVSPRDKPSSPSRQGDSASKPKTSSAPSAPSGETSGLTRAELNLIQKLQRRENEVQSHEQAHIAAGGRFVQGGATYTYRMGPDGKMYAVGGEVSIDTSPVPGDPQATLEKARQIRRAALAPAEPSAQDLQAAAKASRMAARARAEMRSEEGSQAESSGDDRRGQPASEPLSGNRDAAFRGLNQRESLNAPPAPFVLQTYWQQGGEEMYAKHYSGSEVNKRA